MKRLYYSQRKPESKIKGHYVVKETVPQDRLDDCKLRALLVPLTTTAAICGDPLPGYSALDRREHAG